MTSLLYYQEFSYSPPRWVKHGSYPTFAAAARAWREELVGHGFGSRVWIGPSEEGERMVECVGYEAKEGCWR